jgi:Predicted membrane protein (DUF2254)
VEFGVIQIVDIALRAISPAVNDPSTAQPRPNPTHRHKPCPWQRGHAVGEGTEEHPQRPLRSPFAHEADQIRGENWVEASVSVISGMAKTMEATVMIEVARRSG